MLSLITHILIGTSGEESNKINILRVKRKTAYLNGFWVVLPIIIIGWVM